MSKTAKKPVSSTYRVAGYVLLLVIGSIIGLTSSRAYRARATHDLLIGIDKHDTGMVKDALDRGADANSIDNKLGADRQMPQGKVQSVINNITGNHPDDSQWTALMSAAQSGQTDSVAALLAHKASPNVRSISGYTALTLAAYWGHTAVVKLLLEHGADVNIADDEAQTPLSSASYKGYLDIAKMLLDKGAKVNISDSSGSTPLHEAVDGNHLEVVKLLLTRGAKVDLRGGDSDSPLLTAAEGGYYEIAKVLIANGADVNLVDHSNTTPLWRAGLLDHSNVIALLIKSGAKEDMPLAMRAKKEKYLGAAARKLANANTRAQLMSELVELVKRKREHINQLAKKIERGH